jgi:hypothetical protein
MVMETMGWHPLVQKLLWEMHVASTGSKVIMGNALTALHHHNNTAVASVHIEVGPNY